MLWPGRAEARALSAARRASPPMSATMPRPMPASIPAERSATPPIRRPALIRANAQWPASTYPRLTRPRPRRGDTVLLTLPVYVCAAGTTAACTGCRQWHTQPQQPVRGAGPGRPARPAAADTAHRVQLFAQPGLPRRPRDAMAPMFGDWNYARSTHRDAQRAATCTTKGYVYIQHLLDESPTVHVQFRQSRSNSQAARDYLSPTHVTTRTRTVSGPGHLSKDLFELPGGPLQLGGRRAFRHESLYRSPARTTIITARPSVISRSTPSARPASARSNRPISK
jgi:hypothetical protein